MLIPGASAKCPGKMFTKFFCIKLLPTFRKRDSDHHECRSAVAALQAVSINESALDWMQLFASARKRLNRPDFPSINLGSNDDA